MARSSSRRPAPASNSRSIFGGKTQARPASTMSAPAAAAPAYRSPAQAAAPAAAPMSAPAQAAPQQPGMFAQMATTAAGVAVGSAVGHTLGAGLTSMFSGSGSNEAAQQQQQAVPAAQSQVTQQQATPACDADARNFTRCIEESNGNYQACDFYLQQLKACQQAAQQY